MIYLDYAATTPVKPGVREVLAREFAEIGNASSVHAAGRRARRIVEEARESIAELVGSLPSEIIFTSGGTESDNLAVKGMSEWVRASAPARNLIVISNVEHPAVLDPANALGQAGGQVLELKVRASGVLDVEEVVAQLHEHRERISMVSVMWANNELGTVQPVREIAQAATELGLVAHSDAVQAAGPIAMDYRSSGLTALTLSAHKLGGPQGVGALVLDRKAKCVPQTFGGGQERDLRSGTLSTALIAGFGEAARLALVEREAVNAKVSALRARLEAKVLAAFPGTVINAVASERIPGTSSITLPGVDSAALLIALDAMGICCSAGSACAAGSLKPSKTLPAIGLDALSALATIRVSLGWASSESDVDEFCAALERAVPLSQAVI